MYYIALMYLCILQNKYHIFHIHQFVIEGMEESVHTTANSITHMLHKNQLQ